MIIRAISVISFILILCMAGQAQEVVVTGFPLGVGNDIDSSFFEPYRLQLQSVADSLRADPLSMAIVTGGVDGIRYKANNDSQNPGLAVGRALALRNYLVSSFGIDSTRILIQSNYAEKKGEVYRFAGVRIYRGLSNIDTRIESLEKRPPVENRITEIKEITHIIKENIGIQLGVGFSSSPYGGIPIVTAAITSKRFIFIEGIFGHTLWNSSYRILDIDFSTRRRLAGGQLIIYPSSKIPVGVVGGWVRVEEVSRKYNEYVRMSEGPVIGLRVTPLDYISITAVQNTTRLNNAADIVSRSKSNQFLFYMTVHLQFGGGI